ncbi:hypothetical protein GF371_04165 [Candidatus Woesearchaeota archaeon]|nr:hypothetical protein [Candidatus Woesearchaeota archaeon]
MDVSKIREKGDLAKSLVQRGIAANLQDAYKMIEAKGMIKTNSTSDSDHQKAMEEIKVDEEIEQIAGSNNGILKRVEQLEHMLAQFKEFFNKYKNNNDNNLKELDSGIKMLMRKIDSGAATNVQKRETRQEPQQQRSQHPEQSQEQKQKPQNQAQTPGSNLDPSQFSVEKIFNNSHGRMNKDKK